MSCTHGYFSNYEGGPVVKFEPPQAVVAALKAQDPDLDCVWKDRFGGRLCIVSKVAYEAEINKDELPDEVVILIITADDGGPRQLELTDLHRMKQAGLNSFGERLGEMKEGNAALDAAAEVRFNALLSDMFKDWEKTTVYAGEHRSPRNNSSTQRICEHGFRDVKCPLCRPDKKMIFRMGAPSGGDFNGYDTLDDPTLLRQVRTLTRQAEDATQDPGQFEA